MTNCDDDDVARRFATWTGTDGLRAQPFQDDDFGALKAALMTAGRHGDIAALDEIQAGSKLEDVAPSWQLDQICDLVKSGLRYEHCGDVATAAQQYRNAISLDSQVSSIGARMFAAQSLSAAMLESGDVPGAVEAAETAVKIVEPLESPCATFIVQLTLARAQLAANQLEEAERILDVPASPDGIECPVQELQRCCVLARCGLVRGDNRAVEEHLRKARIHNDTIGVGPQPFGVLSVRSAMWAIVAAHQESLDQHADALSAHAKSVELAEESLSSCPMPRRRWVLQLAIRYEAMAECNRLLGHIEEAYRARHIATLLRHSQGAGL